MLRKFLIVISCIASFLYEHNAVAQDYRLYFHKPDNNEINIIKKIINHGNNKEFIKKYPLSYNDDILVAEYYMNDGADKALLIVNMNMYWCGGVSFCLDIWKKQKNGWRDVSQRDDFVADENYYIDILDKKDHGWHEYLNPFDNRVRIYDMKSKEYECPACSDDKG